MPSGEKQVIDSSYVSPRLAQMATETAELLQKYGEGLGRFAANQNHFCV